MNLLAFQAFHLSLTENKTCPIRDFTLAFTRVDSLDAELLAWDHINFIDIKNNRWNCDCKISWIKDSYVEELVGNQI